MKHIIISGIEPEMFYPNEGIVSESKKKALAKVP